MRIFETTVAEYAVSWYRVPVEKNLLRRLTARSDLAGLAQSVGHLAVAGLTGWFAFYAWWHLPWPWIVLAFFLHGTVMSHLIAGFHELCHGTPFRSRWLNEPFLWIYSFLSWNNHVLFRGSHIRHHQYTVWKGWDMEVILPQKVRLVDFLLAFVIHPVATYAQVGIHVRHCLGILGGEWEKRIFAEDGPEKKRELFLFGRIIVLGHIALAVLFILLGVWILIPIWLTPFYASWLFYLSGMPQHFGLSPSVPDWRRSCRTVLQDPVSSFLYWRMNYHTEHHMYAAVPFYKLGRLHRAIAHDSPPPNRGILSAWREIISCARMQKTNPDWAFDPYLRTAGRATITA